MVKEKVAEDQKVVHILGSFEDHQITDWTNTQSATLMIMKFPDFMEAFRECWLPRNWKKAVLSQMQKCHLNLDRETFESWATQFQSLNTTLQNTTSILSDKQVRSQLESLMDKDLQVITK